jgi:hypothetical protein
MRADAARDGGDGDAVGGSDRKATVAVGVADAAGRMGGVERSQPTSSSAQHRRRGRVTSG